MANSTHFVYGLHDGDGRIRYVGKTSRSVSKRLQEHLWNATIGTRRPVYMWIKSRGVDSVHAEILGRYETEEEAFGAEVGFIKSLNTLIPNGMNLTIGGEGSSGLRMTDEQRRRISDGHKGLVMSDETKKKLSIANRGQVPWSKGLRGPAYPRYGVKNPKLSAALLQNESRRGVNNWNALLTDAIVVKMFEMRAARIPVNQIAEKFGVDKDTVFGALSRKSWKHVEIPDDLLRESRRGGRFLTDEDAVEIHGLYRTGEYSQTLLAEMFGVKQGSVGALVTGRTRKYLNLEPIRVGKGSRQKGFYPDHNPDRQAA